MGAPPGLSPHGYGTVGVIDSSNSKGLTPYIHVTNMPNPKTCEVCQEEFDGRKTKCPHCEKAKEVQEEANDLLRKTQELEEENEKLRQGEAAAPGGPAAMTVMLELAWSMQAMQVCRP